MGGPRQHEDRMRHVGSGLKSRELAFVDQIVAEAAEATSGLEIGEVRASDHAQRGIGEAGTIAVAILEA